MTFGVLSNILFLGLSCAVILIGLGTDATIQFHHERTRSQLLLAGIIGFSASVATLLETVAVAWRKPKNRT